MLAALLFLGVFLWRVQVLGVTEYRTSLDRQSMRRVRLPAPRGVIADRLGVRLADNRPSFCIAVYIEELKQPGRWNRTIDRVDEVISRLAAVLGLEKQVDREDIWNHIRRRLPLPFLAWRDVGGEALARWAEHSAMFPGVDVHIEPVRFYPHGSLAAHVLGYVGQSDPARDPDVPYHYYLPEVEGQYGVEKAFDDVFAGTAGGKLLRVDAAGFKYEEVHERAPVPGRGLRLTVDSRIQRAAERLLADRRGAAVVLDPRNGDVLALASSPAFDPNAFSSRLSPAVWRRLRSDPQRPLFNRAVSGTYPPGSTFKTLVALAALENRRAAGDSRFNCPGYFDIGGVRFHCWKRSGHGLVAMREALEQSCNAYFCQLGLSCGYEYIYHMAEAVGFGRPTGIRLGAELGGLLPGDAWKRSRYRDGWRAGDTCNVSIGQGALLVTPLQMAVFTAAMANGGYVFRPRLLFQPGRKGELVNDLHWSPASLQVVRGGMYDVVQDPSGTGKRARIEGVEMGGKTGTAEYGPKSDRRKYAWMIAFAPFRDARYAVAVVVEDAVSGGTTAAPMIRELMAEIFVLEREDEAAGRRRA